MEKINIWLDDERDPRLFDTSIEWIWVKNPHEFNHLYQANYPNIGVISFDNDLGSGYAEGYTILNEIESDHSGYHPPFEIRCHSQNPVARNRMELTVRMMKDRGVITN